MTRIPPFDPDTTTCRDVASRFGTPAYLYDMEALAVRARAVASFDVPFGLTPRFAVKANPNRAILRLFAQAGLGFDASSVYEVRRVQAAGIPARDVQLTAQHLGEGFEDLVREGTPFTACSLAQIEQFGAALPGGELGVRINPGEGTGHNNRTNVAGPAASFGIWHEHLPAARQTAERLGLRITHAHHHVGSGGDPEKWTAIAGTTLALVEDFPDVHTVNLGGGFKVARVPGEKEMDLGRAAAGVSRLLQGFAERTGRELHAEIEPGTWLTAHAGVIVARVTDVVDTGRDGHTFVKLDAGMAEILRPSMYGAQQPVTFHAGLPDRPLGGPRPLVVVGPCCESGDVLTPAPGDPETLGPRDLPLPAVGDLAVIGGAGAYCASMAARNYNSVPAAPEILRHPDGSLDLVRRRQTLDDVLREETG